MKNKQKGIAKVAIVAIFVVVIVVVSVVAVLLMEPPAEVGSPSTEEPTTTPPEQPTPMPTEEEDTMEEDEITYIDVSPEEAKNLIDTNPDLIVIDVSPHYDEGHLPRAVHYYLGDGSLDAAIPNLDPNGEYLVYCHVDSVAIAGAQRLIDAGFTTVYRLEGNFGAWRAAGYPIEM